MASRTRGGVLLALTLVLLAAPAAAQDAKMAEGTWTGTVFPPDDQIIDLDYLVAYGEHGLEIELLPPPELGAGTLFAADVLYDGVSLSFTLDVGEVVQCTLYGEEDGHLEGECVDSSGMGAIMTMFPPEDGP